MYLHVQRLINEIVPDEPDPAAANALQEGLGGQFGEMRTMMQYLFQSINFRGPAGKPYRDLLQGIGTEGSCGDALGRCQVLLHQDRRKNTALENRQPL